MAYEIGIWSTRELQSYCADQYNNPREAAHNVRDHVESMAAEWGKNVNVVTRISRIDAPVEDVFTSFTAEDPCNSSNNKYYETLLDWWEDEAECNYTIQKDSNILLTSTNNTVGGRGFVGDSPYCVARTGQVCAEASFVRRFANQGSGWDGVHTALHEIGHNLMTPQPSGNNCDTSTAHHHETGKLNRDSDTWHVTPMSSVYVDCITPYNWCSSYSSDQNPSGVDMRWHSCCVNFWREA